MICYTYKALRIYTKLHFEMMKMISVEIKIETSTKMYISRRKAMVLLFGP